jgi:hypothetical protein
MQIASSGDSLEKVEGYLTLTFSFALSYVVKLFCRAGSKALKPHWASRWLPKQRLLSIAVRKICAKLETISLP